MREEAFTIRLACEDDLHAITTCVHSAYTIYLTRMDKAPAPLFANYKALLARDTIYVLVSAERVCGVLVMMPQDTHMFIENVAVDSRSQGQGFGKALMAFAEQEARKARLSEIRLYTNELMTENLRFYRKLGFEEIDRRVEDGYRRVFLHKALS